MRRVKWIPLAMAAVLASSVGLEEAQPDGEAGASEGDQAASAPLLALTSATGGTLSSAADTLLPEVQLPATTSTTAPPPTTTTAPPVTEPPPPPPPPPPAFTCPVQGEVSFVDSWGWPRSGGRTHQGVDMMASTGTPTVAPVSGQVEHGDSGLGGLSWHLYGDDGDTYYGAHLSAYENVGVGWVAAGTVIGYLGDSGNAAGTPHLHFEFHPGGGEAVNPHQKVSEAC